MIGTLLNNLRTWHRNRRAIAELNRYSDEELRDIGITSDQITDYVLGRITTDTVSMRPVVVGNVIYFTPLCCPARSTVDTPSAHR